MTMTSTPPARRYTKAALTRPFVGRERRTISNRSRVITAR